MENDTEKHNAGSGVDQQRLVRLCVEAPTGSGNIYKGDIVPEPGGEHWVSQNEEEAPNTRRFLEYFRETNA